MLRLQVITVVAVILFSPFLQAADNAPMVLTAQGTIHKVDKDSLTIKRRSADGKFDKDLVLKLTGTSRFSVLSTQKRADKIVLVQKDTDAKGLAEKQTIAVIYANNADDHVLLTAVVEAP